MRYPGVKLGSKPLELGAMGPLFGIQLIGTAAVEIMKRPRLLFMGMLPPLIVTLLYLLITIIGGPALFSALTAWVAQFTASWPTWAGSVIAWLLMIVLVAGVVVIAAVSFTTLTLALGGPIYDRISETIEREVLGFTATQSDGLGTAVMRSASQSLIIFCLSMLVVALSTLFGLIPTIGTIASLAMSLCCGGFLVTTELLGGSFGRRGMPRLNTRWRYMRATPLGTLSFAIPAQFVLSIPVVSVFAFPFFSAGATLLAHELLTERPAPPMAGKDQHDLTI